MVKWLEYKKQVEIALDKNNITNAELWNKILKLERLCVTCSNLSDTQDFSKYSLSKPYVTAVELLKVLMTNKQFVEYVTKEHNYKVGESFGVFHIMLNKHF